MKRIASVLACALVVAGCSPSQPGTQQRAVSQAKPLQRLQAPDAAFVTADGQTVTLQRFTGRVVVLNLWAPWCNPCVREMPSLNALARRAPETAVITVSMDVQGP